MKSLSAVECFVALFDASLAALCFALACAVVVAAAPPELVAASEPVPMSFDVAVPVWEPVSADTTRVAAGN